MTNWTVPPKMVWIQTQGFLQWVGVPECSSAKRSPLMQVSSRASQRAASAARSASWSAPLQLCSLSRSISRCCLPNKSKGNISPDQHYHNRIMKEDKQAMIGASQQAHILVRDSSCVSVAILEWTPGPCEQIHRHDMNMTTLAGHPSMQNQLVHPIPWTDYSARHSMQNAPSPLHACMSEAARNQTIDFP